MHRVKFAVSYRYRAVPLHLGLAPTMAASKMESMPTELPRVPSMEISTCLPVSLKLGHYPNMKSPLVFVMMAAASIAMPAMGQTETKPAPPTATVYVYRIKVRLVARALRPLIYFDGLELGQLCASGPVPTAAPTSVISTTPIC